MEAKPILFIAHVVVIGEVSNTLLVIYKKGLADDSKEFHEKIIRQK